MSMPSLPDARTLAALVTNVTQPMCGISFIPAEPQVRSPTLRWRVASLPIRGTHPVRVTLSSDQSGCETLGSALFAIPREELESSMIDDSLCELLNMAAGQIKSALGLDQALGLPKIVAADTLPPTPEGEPSGVVLRSQGVVDLVISVFESE
jgi:hypothetical protein